MYVVADRISARLRYSCIWLFAIVHVLNLDLQLCVAKFSIHSIFISRMMAPRSFMAQLQFPLYKPATEFRNSVAGLYKGNCN